MKQHTAQFSATPKRVTLKVEDRIHRFPATAGFRYLITLLQNPGKTFISRHLAHGEQTPPPEYQSLIESSEAERQNQYLYSFTYLPPLAKADGRTIREVSARLNFLLEKEAMLREANDYATLDDLLDEKEQLIRYLGEVLRKNGKVKNYLDADRKAAAAVNKALSRAITRIADCEPELGRELKRCIHAWYEVYYQPGEWGVVRG
jgi:hypothetical protein